MKAPILLKTILDICFVLLVIDLIAPLLLFLLLHSTENPVTIEVNNRVIETFTTKTRLLLLGDFLVSALSVYVIYLIRKLIRTFFKNKFFTKIQASLFNLIGQLMIVSALAKFAVNFLSAGLLDKDSSRFSLKMDFSFDNLLFILALGLFFIYLGKLFRHAQILKEENELTI